MSRVVFSQISRCSKLGYLRKMYFFELKVLPYFSEFYSLYVLSKQEGKKQNDLRSCSTPAVPLCLPDNKDTLESVRYENSPRIFWKIYTPRRPPKVSLLCRSGGACVVM